MIGVVLVYCGLILLFLGTVSLIYPIRLVGIRTRGRAARIAAAGLAVFLAGAVWPAPEVTIQSPRAKLDEFAPVYQFNEVHTIRIAAPRERVYRALKEVTAKEIVLFRTLTWIRRGGRAGPENILNAPEDMPLLEVATRTSFLTLADEPGQEIVVGTLVAAPKDWRPKKGATPEDFKALRQPGFALAAMNFRLEEEGAGGTRVTTETRVFATDATARRRFAPYWRVIYPGSALLRGMWLRAIKIRAESMPGQP